MLRSRIIPSLLIHNKGLVKTVKFKDSKYVGDPLNAVKIFNEKEVDELVVFDIDASVKGVEPDYQLISRLANECRMPLCYGGGIKTVEQARKIIQLGVEKVAISSAFLEDVNLVKNIAEVVGRQSVVAVLDVKKSLFGGYDVFTHNGKKKLKADLVKLAQKLEDYGIGELIINSIDNDGVMKGYDYKLTDIIRNAVSLPVTFLGGASSAQDIVELVERYKIVGAAAGSLFVFKGVYKAVLINYLSDSDLTKIHNIQ